MINRLVTLFFLLLFFSFPACGGQNQPDKTQKQPLTDAITSVQQQKKPDEKTTVAAPQATRADEEDADEDSSVFDDEHG
jgi:hypothetical protein